MVNYTKRTIKGSGLVLFMGLIASVISYITRIVLARNLSPAEYGLFFAVFTLVTFFLFFRDLGICFALVKYIPEFLIKKEFNQIKTATISVFIFQFISSSIFALVFYSLAGFLAINYFKDPAAANILRLLLLYIFGSILFRVARSIFNGFQNIKIYSILEPLKNSSVLILMLLFFYLGFGVYAPVYAYALVCFLVFLILTPFLLKIFPWFKYKIESFSSVTKKLFIFGLPIFGVTISGRLISEMDTLILTYFTGLEAVGIYNVILPSAMLFLHFGTSVSAVIFPMVSELWIKEDHRRINAGLRLLHRYSFFLIIPPALTVMVFSEHFITVFFGEGYLAGTFPLKILIAGMLLYVVASVNYSIIGAIGRPKTIAYIVSFVALFNIITNMILIPIWGIVGAALTTSLSYLLALIISTNRVLHYIPIKFPKEIWLKMIFIGLLYFGVVHYLQQILKLNSWLELPISVILALAVYLFVGYRMRIIDLDEIKRYAKLLLK